MWRIPLLMLVLVNLLASPAARAVETIIAQPDTVSPAEITGRYLLIDGRGRAVSHEDFPGRFQLLTFGFTNCPDVCPTTLAEMTAVMNALGENAIRVQPIFISLDPERETGESLRSYVTYFHPALLALTGSPELLRRAADNFKVHYEKVREPGAAENDYMIDHSTGMFLLGPDGRYLRKFGYGTPVAEIVAVLRAFMAARHP